MSTLTTATSSGPRAVLTFLLTHGSAEITTLASHLGRDVAQLHRATQRLARRGLLVLEGDKIGLAASARRSVARYVEGTITLRELTSAL